MQVIFHIATMMPNRDNDPKCYKKLRHIGNDFVAIVYNNAGDGSNYKLGTVKGQFIYACVVITPLDEGSNRVEIVCRPELNEPLGHVKVLYTKLSYSIIVVKFNYTLSTIYSKTYLINSYRNPKPYLTVIWLFLCDNKPFIVRLQHKFNKR